MLFYKADYEAGGFVILEITESRKIGKFTAIIGWKPIFTYGNIKDINFRLFEKQSKKECFFLSDPNIYANLKDIVDHVKYDMDQYVKVARDLKEDNKMLIKEIEKDTEELLLECNTLIKKYDKQIRDFSNLDLERELEKRGLIV